MILLDANVLIFSHHERAPEFRRMNDWLKAELQQGQKIGLSWITVWAFLRIVTNQRLPNPLPAELAFQRIRRLLEHPQFSRLEPGDRHLEIMEALVEQGQATGAMISDAVLAAIAIEHGAILASTDRDFSRFPGLRWIDPLQGA